ncbi:MAG: hypothetical protein LC646_05840 [Xanthomonadaceae bacterium]|nr:hypothetical protein [Xanthomonadaceae bacterium]
MFKPLEMMNMKTDPKKHSASNENQGEGDRESAKRYNEATQKFVESGKVDEAARKAAEQDPEEAKRSERKGRERAKEVDPAVHREYDKPAK